MLCLDVCVGGGCGNTFKGYLVPWGRVGRGREGTSIRLLSLGGMANYFGMVQIFGMMYLVAVIHSMVRNMAPFGGTCVVYLHPYIPNNGKSEQGHCYKVTVPKRVGPITVHLGGGACGSLH